MRHSGQQTPNAPRRSYRREGQLAVGERLEAGDPGRVRIALDWAGSGGDSGRLTGEGQGGRHVAVGERHRGDPSPRLLVSDAVGRGIGSGDGGGAVSQRSGQLVSPAGRARLAGCEQGTNQGAESGSYPDDGRSQPSEHRRMTRYELQPAGPSLGRVRDLLVTLSRGSSPRWLPPAT